MMRKIIALSTKVDGCTEEYYQNHKDQFDGVDIEYIRSMMYSFEKDEHFEICQFFKRLILEKGGELKGDVITILTKGDNVVHEEYEYIYQGSCIRGSYADIYNPVTEDTITVPIESIKKKGKVILKA